MSTSTPDGEPMPEATEEATADAGHPRPAAKDEFLVPGPTSESNAGLARWGITWIVFSILLMLVMLGITVVCYFIGTWLHLG
ncbi:MAG TPA: hypothetical protein PK593_02965 [Thermomicrobiales bacterium]|jgi:hypothetical protein|nr:hypothetical protein [Thermomicrobiales bacterium]HQZ89449.1 hypothetical protein [Thermomicrobiales bacterium]HRA32614.1 hypothetical protein [Thermomicrobiales bacterium]